MTENPNPRGWTNGRCFIDLGRVVVVRGSLVHFEGLVEPVQCHLSTEDQRSLFEALLIYRSGR